VERVVIDPGAVGPSRLISATIARRRSSTKGTYRSVLFGTMGTPRPPGSATGFPGAVASAPYTSAERSELMFMAKAQRTKPIRHSALVMITAGIGAGVSPVELVALRTIDVSRSRGHVVLFVGGLRSRVVAVRPPYGARLESLAAETRDDFLFRPGPAERTYKNFVNGFCRHLVSDPEAPQLSMGRCRSSFIRDHLAMGTTLVV
jgi:hypothetical protein